MIGKLFWAYTIILVLLAVLPINGSESTINNTYVVSIRLDYLLHCLVYIPWMFLLGWMTEATIKKKAGTVLSYVLIAFVFAFVNEGIQYFLPYRAYNINDLLANGLGVLLGSVVFWFPLWRNDLAAD